MKKQELIDFIVKELPSSRPGVIKVFVDCMEIHAGKEHDYNGEKGIDSDRNNLVEMFYDIKRKYRRLKHLTVERMEPMVSESAVDTARDLVNYAAIIAEELEKQHGN